MNSTPANHGQNGNGHQKVRASSGCLFTTLPTREEITRRAHEIYLRNGCRNDQPEQDWFQAERELLTEAVEKDEEPEPDACMDEGFVQEAAASLPSRRYVRPLSYELYRNDRGNLQRAV